MKKNRNRIRFRFAEGRMFSYRCPDCKRYNGGGIDNEEFTKWRKMDKFSPLNVPCVWCGLGPVVMEH